MKKKQFESLCQRLSPHLAGFSCNGWLLARPVVNGILAGFACDASGFDSAKFTVVAFALPLYVPTNHLHFNFGFRLKDERGCEIWWSAEDPELERRLLENIQRDGLPFLRAFDDPTGFADAFRRVGNETDPYCLEAIAFSFAKCGDFAQATSGLQKLLTVLRPNVVWHGAIRERADRLLSALKESPSAVTKLLDAWTRDSVDNLRL